MLVYQNREHYTRPGAAVALILSETNSSSLAKSFSIFILNSIPETGEKFNGNK
jgi:hypothetical protein